MDLQSKVKGFLEKEHVSVLTILLPEGTPHSAAMHYASNDGQFIFFTKMESHKAKNLKFGKKYKATVTVGFDEKKMVEFQSKGLVEKIDRAKSKTEESVFANKFKGAKLDDDHVVLKYTPTWWRYTEYKPKFFTLESK